MIDLAEDVDRLPLVAAGLLAARVGIDPRGLGHLAAHFQGRLVLAAGEVAVAHHVPEAIQQFALGIAIGVAIARGSGVLVGPQVQQGGGGGKGGLIGGRIVGILRQETLQHPPRPANQVHMVELRAVQFGMETAGVQPVAEPPEGRQDSSLQAGRHSAPRTDPPPA